MPLQALVFSSKLQIGIYHYMQKTDGRFARFDSAFMEIRRTVKVESKMKDINLSEAVVYNYTSSSTVRHELDAFARRKTRVR